MLSLSPTQQYVSNHIWENTFLRKYVHETINISPSLKFMVQELGIIMNSQFQVFI
jgi:hypothetical protein